MPTLATPAASPAISDSFRWTQLVLGIACMVMIANLQYGWTFFVPDIQKAFKWDRASIQLARRGLSRSKAGLSTSMDRGLSSFSVVFSAELDG